MSEFLLIAPSDWEQATPEQLQLVLDNVGGIDSIRSMIDAGQIGEIWNTLDPIRANSQSVSAMMLVQSQLWFKVT